MSQKAVSFNPACKRLKCMDHLSVDNTTQQNLKRKAALFRDSTIFFTRKGIEKTKPKQNSSSYHVLG